MILKTINFEAFKVDGMTCSPIPGVIGNNPSFFVPDGWQDELMERNIPFEKVDESELQKPEMPQ